MLKVELLKAKQLELKEQTRTDASDEIKNSKAKYETHPNHPLFPSNVPASPPRRPKVDHAGAPFPLRLPHAHDRLGRFVRAFATHASSNRRAFV